MSPRIIELARPIRRRIGSITICIKRDAVFVRGKGKRTWRRIEWDRILSLVEHSDRPILAEAEVAIGRRVRSAMTKRRRAKPSSPTRGEPQHVSDNAT